MHALRRYIQGSMDAHGWKPSDLAHASGLSTQLISQLLNDDRDMLPAIPKRSTLEGLAKAFGTNVSHVTTYVFEAMGYSLEQAREAVDLSQVRSKDLLDALAARLPDDSRQAGPHDGTPMNPAGPGPADELHRKRRRRRLSDPPLTVPDADKKVALDDLGLLKEREAQQDQP
jgi:transcriptional regulator with XRE-family HTH domain